MYWESERKFFFLTEIISKLLMNLMGSYFEFKFIFSRNESIRRIPA